MASPNNGNGNSADNPPTTLDSPTSAGFPTDQLPPNTNNSYMSDDFDDDEEAAVDPEIILDEPEGVEEDDDGEDLYNDDFLKDYQEMEEQDQYEVEGLNDSMEDERDLDQIMRDCRAADMELESREARLSNTRRNPQLLHDQDTDEDTYRPPKRARAGNRPPDGGPSQEDTEAACNAGGW